MSAKTTKKDVVAFILWSIKNTNAQKQFVNEVTNKPVGSEFIYMTMKNGKIFRLTVNEI